MRRLSALAALAVVWLVSQPAAQEPSPATQTFRTGVDVIRVDVTVLDRNRQPVRGLTAGDFTIRENGEPQRIVAVTEVDARTADPTPSAWMRYAPRDVTSNDLADQLGEGQAIAIVLDDFSIPDDSVEMAVSTREVARFIVNSLGPSDVAAVVFPFKPGRTEDFTHDRARLLAAIDRFESEQPEWRTLQPQYSTPLEGDVQRYNTALGRHPCLQLQPVIPTLRAVTSRLASVPNRRKALFFVSTGMPFTFMPGRTRCQTMLYDEMRRTFETAQRYNVNIHGVDPAGAAGYQRYLQRQRVRNQRMVPAQDAFAARASASRRHDFLETLGEQTGGRPIVDTDDLDRAIAEVLDEYASYYLIGYETTNGEPDGKFRRLEIDVRGRDVDVRTRSGRWAPGKDRVVADGRPPAGGCWLDCWHDPPSASEFQLVGLAPHQPLRLRAVLHPIARASGAPDLVDVAAVLTVRLPAVVRQATETVNVVRTAYDPAGRASKPVQETFTREIAPAAGDEITYDVHSRFSLPPGRHRVRFNAASRVADASGSVFVEVEVPEFPRSGLAVSPIVLGRSPSGENPLAPLVAVVPTTARDFAKGDQVMAWLTFSPGDGMPAGSVSVDATLLGADNAETVEIPPAVISGEAFRDTGTAAHAIELPLSRLDSGLHLLSVTVTADGRRSIRRDLVFRVR